MKPIPNWKKVLAFIADFLGCFLFFGYTIAYFTGDIKGVGFELNGAPALFLFTLMIGYFVIMNKFLGGTLGKKLFGIGKVKPKS